MTKGPARFPTIHEDGDGTWIGMNPIRTFALWVVFMMMFLCIADASPLNTEDFSMVVFGIILPTIAAGIVSVMANKRAERARFDPVGVTVGDDGVHLLEDNMSAFLHFAELAEVSWDGGSCRLTKRDHTFLTFHPLDDADFRKRLEEKRAEYASRKRVRVVTSFGPKTGESASDWAARMASRDGNAYRGHAPTHHELVRIARDPTRRRRLDRIGAALALRDAPAAVKNEVREAIVSLADQELAEALTNALEGEVDEALLADADVNPEGQSSPATHALD